MTLSRLVTPSSSPLLATTLHPTLACNQSVSSPLPAPGPGPASHPDPRPHLVFGLLARRKVAIADIETLEAKLRSAYELLRNLDAIIRIEDPSADLAPIRAVKVSDRSKISSTLARGDVSSLCLECLREAQGAERSSRQVADHIIRRRQLVLPTPRHMDDFCSSVTMALARHAKRGLLERTGETGNRAGLWRIARPAGGLGINS